MLGWWCEVFFHLAAMYRTPAMSLMLSYLLSHFTPITTLKEKYYLSIFQMKKLNFKEAKTTHTLSCCPCICHPVGNEQCICVYVYIDRLRRRIQRTYTKVMDGCIEVGGGMVDVFKGSSVVSVMNNQLLLQERNSISLCILIFKKWIHSSLNGEWPTSRSCL